MSHALPGNGSGGKGNVDQDVLARLAGLIQSAVQLFCPTQRIEVLKNLILAHISEEVEAAPFGTNSERIRRLVYRGAPAAAATVAAAEPAASNAADAVAASASAKSLLVLAPLPDGAPCVCVCVCMCTCVVGGCAI